MKIIVRKIFTLPLVITLILLAIAYSTFLSEVEHVKASTKSILDARAVYYIQYLKFLSASNTSMKKSLEHAFYKVKKGDLKDSLLDSISYFKQFDAYGLSPFDHAEAKDHLNGTLTMLGSLDVNDQDLRDELTAVISIDKQISMLHEKKGLAIWTYYTSAKGFLYLVPSFPVESFQITPQLYKKAFWTQAEPTVNPSGKLIVTDLYDDSAGQGLMITISSPVFSNEKFLGIASVDIGIEYMNSILNYGETIGKSSVVDEKKILVAANNPFTLGEGLPVLKFDTKGQWFKAGGSWSYGLPLFNDELYLVHIINRFELMMAAARASLVIWLSLLLASGLSYIASFMYHSSGRNKQLMITDSLTKLYNRRGFYTLLKPVYAHLKRSSKTCGVLMIDIDYFKKVNDTYGHAVGDEVLFSIGKTLSNSMRDSSICSRWGGEEFIVFLQKATFDSAQVVAERIRQAVEKKKHGSENLCVTVSIGLCVDKANDDFDTMVAQADQALYKAKENGRNQVVLYDVK